MTEPGSPRNQATWLSPPGETIRAGIDHAGWTLREFAERMDYTEKHINQLLAAKAPINTDTAQRLSRVLGGTESFWLERESQYRQELARREEEKALVGWIDWLDELPRSYLRKHDFIQTARKGIDEVRECLRFYGVASPDAWRERNNTLQASFRAGSMECATDGAITTWLRVGENRAAKIDCAPYSKEAFLASLINLRALTRHNNPEDFLPEMKRLCANAGVAFVPFPAPKGCPAYGVTRWLTPGKAMLMLSNRYKTDDQWWFSFFHECGHILLHSKKMTFIDLAMSKERNEIEEQADSFAEKTLIPESFAQELANLKLSQASIRNFANKIGVSPGVVVGRLQFEKRIAFNRCNGLKAKFEWTAPP